MSLSCQDYFSLVTPGTKRAKYSSAPPAAIFHLSPLPWIIYVVQKVAFTPIFSYHQDRLSFCRVLQDTRGLLQLSGMGIIANDMRIWFYFYWDRACEVWICGWGEFSPQSMFIVRLASCCRITQAVMLWSMLPFPSRVVCNYYCTLLDNYINTQHLWRGPFPSSNLACIVTPSTRAQSHKGNTILHLVNTYLSDKMWWFELWFNIILGLRAVWTQTLKGPLHDRSTRMCLCGRVGWQICAVWWWSDVWVLGGHADCWLPRWHAHHRCVQLKNATSIKVLFFQRLHNVVTFGWFILPVFGSLLHIQFFIF